MTSNFILTQGRRIRQPNMVPASVVDHVDYTNDVFSNLQVG